ncbi:MAG TPA: aminoglycoside phosphotransferase family protein [Chitinophagaceae bacterium]|nr:aminoglycoside phosphotransferase family protein [Chitinophagaceae bacterium]
MLSKVLQQYDLNDEDPRIETIGSGLINHTWKIDAGGREYILQRVNQNVFPEPGKIAANIELVAAHLKQNHPAYFFVAPIHSRTGQSMIYLQDSGYFRLFPFVAGSYTIDVVNTPEQAFEAAQQFGRFTKLLDDLDSEQLALTIPGFHDLALRYHQFLRSTREGNPGRIRDAAMAINKLLDHAGIVHEFEKIKSDPAFRLRVCHHDCKISNVLFDQSGKAICVIDLDTVMPGYYFSDLGDMMRTYLSPASEEETDISKIAIRDDFYKAIVDGYYGEMKDLLSAEEKAHLFYSGKFIVYMQALRFLADHLMNDPYYGARYEGQNYTRAINQITLLERLLEKEKDLAGYIKM